MAIYKRCSTCGKRASVGDVCECRRRRYKENDRHKSKHEVGFYKSKEWTALRQRAIAQVNGIDIYSLFVNNIIEVGEVVHHIVPVPDDWNKRLDINNLIYLTESNHRIIHSKMKTEKIKTIELIRSFVEKFKREYPGGYQKSFE